MKSNVRSKRITALLLFVVMMMTAVLPAAAAEIKYMPDVTAEMSDAAYWAALYDDSQEVILTQEEIRAFNEDTYLAKGTMVMDLRTIKDTFDGKARNESIESSATADAEYYFGWTYGPDGKKAEWSYYEKMIRNCIDRKAKTEMPVRHAVAAERTVLQVFPSENPIWDDPNDHDFNYQYLSAVQVNDPLVLYTTSADGKYYLARSRDCSGWIPAKDVAICADKAEWESAWVIPEEDLLVVYGNKEYTDESYTAPETARRMLGQGTRLELVRGLEPDQLVNNRYPYHNYVIYLPVRLEDGSYEKRMALLPETAKVSVGYLPLTMENIAMVMLNNLGDAYGWGGMMNVEDCSGLIRTVYACFGLEIGRNGNWQWNMNMEKIDMSYMSIEEKCAIIDALPLGASLCFSGHEMMYLGKVDGKYYVISTVSSIMSPDTGKRLRTRDVMINTLDVKRANGQSWLQALNQAFMPCYAKLPGKSYDFPAVSWYRDGVSHSLKNGLIANYENGNFGLNDMAGRAVTANALWKLAGSPESASAAAFTDVSAEHAYLNAIRWAVETGIMAGYGNDAFGPEDTLTREQMMAVLWRYAKYMGYDVSVGEETNILSYNDAGKVSDYAIPAMQWACGSGLLVGRPGENGKGMFLDPKSSTTRAQLAVMLQRFDAWMAQAEKVPVEHVIDLSAGDIIFSADPAAESASGVLPAVDRYSQDEGATWTLLEGEIVVTSSEATDHGIQFHNDVPCGDVVITLDGVNTTGTFELAVTGGSTLRIRGDVHTGVLVTGLEQSMTICGAGNGLTDTLTASCDYGHCIISDKNVTIKNLSSLQVSAQKSGIYSVEGQIVLENVKGSIRGGEGFPALYNEKESAVNTVNGKPVTEIGSVLNF